MLFLLNACLLGFVELSSSLLASADTSFDASSYQTTSRLLYFFLILASIIYSRTHFTSFTYDPSKDVLGLGFDLPSHKKALNGLICGILFPFALLHVYWRHAYPGAEMSPMMTSTPFVVALFVVGIENIWMWSLFAIFQGYQLIYQYQTDRLSLGPDLGPDLDLDYGIYIISLLIMCGLLHRAGSYQHLSLFEDSLVMMTGGAMLEFILTTGTNTYGGGAFDLEVVLHISAMGFLSLVLLVCLLGHVEVYLGRSVASAVVIAHPVLVLASIGGYLRANPLVWVWKFISHTESALMWCMIWVVSIILTAMLAPLALYKFRWSRVTCRKLFHILVSIMFLPPLHQGLGVFVSLAMAVVLCIMIYLEMVRHFYYQSHSHRERQRLSVVGEQVMSCLNTVTSYFSNFTATATANANDANDANDAKGMAFVSDHITLLLGCYISTLAASAFGQDQQALDPWLASVGCLMVGIGDAAGAVAGFNWGRHRWSHLHNNKRTIEGTICGIFAIAAMALFLEYWFGVRAFLLINIGKIKNDNDYDNDWKAQTREYEVSGQCIAIVITSIFTMFTEALTHENDNIILPMFATLLYLVIMT